MKWISSFDMVAVVDGGTETALNSTCLKSLTTRQQSQPNYILNNTANASKLGKPPPPYLLTVLCLTLD